ncbi:MAG: ATP phosphoribosyltransferase regulatory subunit [Alphaproteobacteria bacterium]
MSNFYNAPFLLPVGMEDILPNEAAFESMITEKMLKHFSTFGYERVNPPLAEYAEGLFAGRNIAERSFRMMDPASHKLLAIRPDITIQVARIASSRLKDAPRPLRLCYMGQVLWVEGNQLNPQRQFGQLGIELIGIRDAKADVELLQIAIESLKAVGIDDISIDITCPPLAGELIDGIDFSESERQLIFEAFNEKNTAQITSFKDKLGSKYKELSTLMTSIGNAKYAYKALTSFEHQGEARRHIDEIGVIIDSLSKQFPDTQITLDPIENRGFKYYSGVSFSIYDKKTLTAVARGGRYRLAQNNEPASGLSFYSHNLLKAAKQPHMPKRIYVPAAESEALAKDYRSKGWVTVRGFDDSSDIENIAIELKCDYYSHNGVLCEIGYDENVEVKARNDFNEDVVDAAQKGRPIFKG